MPQARDLAGSKPGRLQHPAVFSGKAAWSRGVIRGDESEPLFAGAPRNADRAGHPQPFQHVREVSRLVLAAGAKDQVLVHHAACQVVALRFASNWDESAHEGGVDAEPARRGEHVVIVDPPEQNLAGAYELADSPGKPAVEIAQTLAGDRVRGHSQEDLDRQLVRSLDQLRAAQATGGAAAVFLVAIRLRPESAKGRLQPMLLLAHQRAVQRVRELRGEDRKCLPVGAAAIGFPRDSYRA